MLKSQNKEQIILDLMGKHTRENISEHLWPCEWDYRERPEQHLSDNIMSLADAIDLCGKHFFPSLWTDQGWYARSPKEIENWSSANDLNHEVDLSKKQKAADFTNNPEVERQAYILKKNIYGRMVGWLNQGEIDVFMLGDLGVKQGIRQSIWLGADAENVLDSGKIYENANKESWSICRGTFVYLNKEQLEKAISQDDRDNETKECTPLTSEGITDHGQRDYIPDYIEFMLRAVAELNLSADKRENIDDIMVWLDKNWPSDLEGKSGRMIQSMATFLRRPCDKKGGNTSWNQ